MATTLANVSKHTRTVCMLRRNFECPMVRPFTGAQDCTKLQGALLRGFHEGGTHVQGLPVPFHRCRRHDLCRRYNEREPLVSFV